MGWWDRWFGPEARERRVRRKRINTYLDGLATAIRANTVELTLSEVVWHDSGEFRAVASGRHASWNAQIVIHGVSNEWADSYLADSCVQVDDVTFGLDYDGVWSVLKALQKRLEHEEAAKAAGRDRTQLAKERELAAKLP